MIRTILCEVKNDKPNVFHPSASDKEWDLKYRGKLIKLLVFLIFIAHKQNLSQFFQTSAVSLKLP